MNTSIKKSYLYLVLVVSALCLGLTTLPQQAEASLAGEELAGWAWSSTIGWISFSCVNTASCAADGGFDYGVSIDPSSNLDGWAWSSNIGWIKFDGLWNHPPGAGTLSANARIVGSGPSYTLEGWARACAGTADGTCSSMASRSDGWDGWISFSGTNYGVDFTAAGVDVTNGNHWAWGSTVVGWIDMSQVTLGTVVPPVVPPLTPLNFAANPSNVAIGGSADLTWNTTGYTNCTASNDRGMTDWSTADGTVVSIGNQSAGYAVSPPPGDTVYTLNCDGTIETATVSARSDIVIDELLREGSIPTPEPDGTYDGVSIESEFAPSYPIGINNVPYDIELRNTTLNYNLSDAGGGSNLPVYNGSGTFAPSFDFDNVRFGMHVAELDADLPASGVVPEDAPATLTDEDVVGNNFTSPSFIIPPPDPTISITPIDDAVRTGASSGLVVTVNSPINIRCTVRGPGVMQVVSSGTGGPASAYTPTTVNTTVLTGALTSTSEFKLTCVEPLMSYGLGLAAWESSAVIEVVPVYQEI